MSKFEDSYGVACCLDWSNEDRPCDQPIIKCDRRKQLLKSSYKLDYCKDDSERLKRELGRRHEKARGQVEQNIDCKTLQETSELNRNFHKSPKCHHECKILRQSCDHHKPCLIKSDSCDRIRTKIIEECRKLNERKSESPQRDYRKKRLNEPFIMVNNDRFDKSSSKTKKNKTKTSAKTRSKSLNRTYSTNEKLNEKEVKFKIKRPCSITPKQSLTNREQIFPVKCEATQTSPQNSYSEIIRPIKKIQSEKKSEKLDEPKIFGPLSNSMLIEELKKISRHFRLKRKPQHQVFNDETVSNSSDSKSVSSSTLSWSCGDNYDDDDEDEEKKSKIILSKKKSARRNYDYGNYENNSDDTSEYSFKIKMVNNEMPKHKPRHHKKLKMHHKNNKDDFCHYIPIKCHDKSKTRHKLRHRENEDNLLGDLHELCKKCKRIKL
jgi:hypothetical protein